MLYFYLWTDDAYIFFCNRHGLIGVFIEEPMFFLLFFTIDRAPPRVGYKKLRIVSWNVDGLEPNWLMERAMEVCNILLEKDELLADAILLQEVEYPFFFNCAPTLVRIFIYIYIDIYMIHVQDISIPLICVKK